MLPISDDLNLLALHLATRFVLDDDRRILSENAPDRAPGPRLHLEGCARGNLVRLRHDVGAETARAVEALVVAEPPFSDPERAPVQLDEYLRLLGAEAPIRRWWTGPLWTFPDDFAYSSDVATVSSGTPDGERLLAGIRQTGMPMPLVVMGFFGIEDLWEPWCVALHEGQVASIAFAARLGSVGGEVGVATVAALRGRGYASAATAGWARSAALRGRQLFYSTQRENQSSRRVAERLGLRYLGASFSIA